MVVFMVYSYFSNNHIVTLFPTSSVYAKDANEDKEYLITEKDKKKQRKIASKQRGSMRMALEMYYTDEEYRKYRETICSKELP